MEYNLCHCGHFSEEKHNFKHKFTPTITAVYDAKTLHLDALQWQEQQKTSCSFSGCKLAEHFHAKSDSKEDMKKAIIKHTYNPSITSYRHIVIVAPEWVQCYDCGFTQEQHHNRKHLYHVQVELKNIGPNDTVEIYDLCRNKLKYP